MYITTILAVYSVCTRVHSRPKSGSSITREISGRGPGPGAGPGAGPRARARVQGPGARNRGPRGGAPRGGPPGGGPPGGPPRDPYRPLLEGLGVF